MIIPLDADSMALAKNPQLREEAAGYLQIQEDFYGQVRRLGFEFAPKPDPVQPKEQLERLKQGGAIFLNGGRSIHVGRLSPACRACEKGIGSRTFFISFQCNRDCYFCFNHAMKDYGYYLQHERDAKADLYALAEKTPGLQFVGLSGGEPLLHPEKVIDFFQTARTLFPEAYTRLYTNGDFVDSSILRALSKAGLNEIRFSIKMEDFYEGKTIFDSLVSANEHQLVTMVEMPIEPGTEGVMQGILRNLNQIGIFGINLLEMLCSLVHPGAYKERGYLIKNPPWSVLYDYWYPGTLPIAGSEAACLNLLEYALEEGFKLGVHYCSGENKHTAQLFRQNAGGPIPETHTFSENSYFLVSAKAYGKDAMEVLRVFQKSGFQKFRFDPASRILEFPVGMVPTLPNPDMQVGIATSTLERSNGEVLLRELRLDLTTPRIFDPKRDV